MSWRVQLSLIANNLFKMISISINFVLVSSFLGVLVTAFATFRRRVTAKRTLYDLYLSIISQQEDEETLIQISMHEIPAITEGGETTRQPWSLEKSPPPIYPLCYWLYSSPYLKKIKAFCKKIATPGQGLGSAASKY